MIGRKNSVFYVTDEKKKRIYEMSDEWWVTQINSAIGKHRNRPIREIDIQIYTFKGEISSLNAVIKFIHDKMDENIESVKSLKSHILEAIDEKEGDLKKWEMLRRHRSLY